MERTPDFEAVARLLANNRGVGRVVGVVPMSSSAVVVVLTTIRRSRAGFTVRHVGIDLDRLGRSREELFEEEPGSDPPFEYTERPFFDLDDAVLFAAATVTFGRPWPMPIPALADWKALGGPFEEQLRWSNLRPHVLALPTLPLSERVVASVTMWVGGALGLLVLFVAAGGEASAAGGGSGTGFLLFGLKVSVALGAVLLLAKMISFALGWRHRGGPP